MIIYTYEELKFFVEMFKNGNADLLIIEGTGGTGKTQIIQEIMKETQHVRILSHATPMSLYVMGYKFKNLPIIFDDVDTLLYDEQNISLLKMFCETSEVKEIGWLTTCKLLKEQGIPQKYETKSRIIIICNDFYTVTKKIQALKDRGWHLIFKPTDKELLKKMKEIKDKYHGGLSDEEKEKVYRLIEKYARFCNFTLRTFIKGLMLYRECNNGKNLPWKRKLLREMSINPKLALIGELLEKYNEDKERLRRWEMKYSRRSFYDYKSRFMQKCSHI